jgi:hypothetical protein
VDKQGSDLVKSWSFSPSLRKVAQVPASIWKLAGHTRANGAPSNDAFPVVIACASDVVGERAWRPSDVTPRTRFLILLDVPVPAIGKLFPTFDVRRPDQRMHITQDASCIRRLLIAQHRDVPFEGIVDAYRLEDKLVLLLGDLSTRTFPIPRIPELRRLPAEQLDAFELDEDGSFLHWPDEDLHFGVSQLLQAVDPSYLADVEIQRFRASAAIGESISALRERHGLRQADIVGLSERQVRRIEQGVSRLTGDAARSFAAALGMKLENLLEHLATAAAAPTISGARGRRESPSIA